MNQSTTLTASKLSQFPVMMFAIVMGVSGLTLVYQKAALWLSYPSYIASWLVNLDTLLFTVIALIYLIKVIRFQEETKQEFNNPIVINFFSAIPICLLLLSSIYHDIHLGVATILWYLGAILLSFFTFYTISFWISRNMEIQHSNPAWFIPIVGNVIAPVGGSGIVSSDVLMYFFSVGLFFWVILLAIIINRIIFHHQLAQKFLPTLFILIAPPAVGMVSYITITGEFNMFASFLYNITLFFTILLFFMGKNFIKLKFFISWWAFTFPLAAVSIASLFAYHETQGAFYYFVSNVLIVITTAIIALVASQSIKHLFKNEIKK